MNMPFMTSPDEKRTRAQNECSLSKHIQTVYVFTDSWMKAYDMPYKVEQITVEKKILKTGQ